jgi:cobalt-zinc-cadmium efflux system protein
MSDHHTHSHSHHHHHISGKNIGITIGLNFLITVAQIIGGVISGSMALLTDALHNFSDVISLLLSWFTNRLAKRKSTVKQTYGYKRAEILAAFVNSATLIMIAIYLIVEAVSRFMNPEPVLSGLVIWFAAGSILINFISVLLLSKDAKESMNMKSAYLHLLTDVMTSVAVLIGGILMKYYEIYSIDSLLSILIAFYLIFSSYKILWSSIKILMQFTPEEANIKKISSDISDIEAVKNIHHVHIWQLNDKEFHFEAHVEFRKDITITNFQKQLIKIEKILRQYDITHSNIQPEYELCESDDLVVEH